MIKNLIVLLFLLAWLPNASFALTEQERAKEVFSKWKDEGEFISKSVTEDFIQEIITFKASEHITTGNTYRYTFNVPSDYLGVITVKPLKKETNPDIVLATSDTTKCRLNKGKEIIFDKSGRLLLYIFDESGKGGDVELTFHTVFIAPKSEISDEDIFHHIFKYYLD